MPTSLDPQLAMDEQAITNADLEAALERRFKAKDDVDEVRSVLKRATEEINTLLEPLDFPADTALRVGRWRITKRHLPGGMVSFERSASDRIQIGLVEDGEATKPTPIRKGAGSFGKPAAAKADDEADLRPKKPVNTDALRGEADRASAPN
jgi:hypothetical protein